MTKAPRPGGRERAASAPPTEPLGAVAVADGVVKFWRDDKGHGAITCGATSPFDIWCHFSALEIDGYRTLTAGQEVVVEYERANQDSFMYRALSVRVK
jgi:CspA family cold shock protein